MLHQYLTHVEVVSPVKWALPGSLLPQPSFSHLDTPNTTLGRLWWLTYCWSRHRGRLFLFWSSEHLATLQQYQSKKDIKFMYFCWEVAEYSKLKSCLLLQLRVTHGRLVPILVRFHWQICWQGDLSPRLQTSESLHPGIQIMNKWSEIKRPFIVYRLVRCRLKGSVAEYICTVTLLLPIYQPVQIGWTSPFVSFWGSSYSKDTDLCLVSWTE